MKKWFQGGSLVVLAVVIATLVATTFSGTDARARAGAADEGKLTGGPRYTVIETQGFNLLVADNAANKLYYYATDKDVPIGSPLKLRASLDLSQVGQKELKLTPHNLENIRKKDDK